MNYNEYWATEFLMYSLTKITMKIKVLLQPYKNFAFRFSLFFHSTSG